MSNFDSACAEDVENATTGVFAVAADPVPQPAPQAPVYGSFTQQQPRDPNQDLKNRQAMQQQLQQ